MSTDRDRLLAIRELRSCMKHVANLRVSLTGKQDSAAYRLQRALALELSRLERLRRKPVQVELEVRP